MTMSENDWKELTRLRNRLGGKSAEEVQAILEAENRALDERRAADRRQIDATLQRCAVEKPPVLAWIAAALVLAGVLVVGRSVGFGVGAPSFFLGVSLLSSARVYRKWAAGRLRASNTLAPPAH